MLNGLKAKLNAKSIIAACIFVIYLFCCFFIAGFHENWSDEAQSWLLARDCSLKNLIFNELKYEGHPILWYLILKFIQLFNYPYEKLSYISIFISAIGVYLILFKTKIPYYIKLILPFSYYIFFQYSIIARNHCLIFPLLIMISIIYQYKNNKILTYCILLILLANVSFHGYIISFILFFDLFLENIKKLKTKKIIPLFLLLSNYLLTPLYLIKPDDCTFPAKMIDFSDFIYSFFNTCSNIYFNSNTTTSNTILTIITIIFTIFIINISKDKKQKILLYFLNFSLLLVLSIFYRNDWHLGYSFLLIVFSLSLIFNTNYNIEVRKKRVLYFICLILFSIQFFWALKSSLLEIKYNFSPSLQVKDYIKSKNIKKEDLAGFYYNIVSVNPYFSENIFSNTTTSYWEWKQNSYNNLIKNFDKKPYILVDMVGLSMLIATKKIEKIDKYYNSINFYAILISKGKLKENMSMVLFVSNKQEDKK